MATSTNPQATDTTGATGAPECLGSGFDAGVSPSLMVRGAQRMQRVRYVPASGIPVLP
jgi:hypothetical protein